MNDKDKEMEPKPTAERRVTLRVNADLIDDMRNLTGETTIAANSGEITFPPGYVERLSRISNGLIMGINERTNLGIEQP